MAQHLRFPAATGNGEEPRQWNLDDVEKWLRRREMFEPTLSTSVQVWRWLVLRIVARRSAEAIAQAAEVRRDQVDRQSVQLAVDLVSRIPYREQQRWARARLAGFTDLQMAGRAGVGVTLVRLVLDGIPRPARGGRTNPYRLRQLWDQGLPVPVIARQLGRSVERTRQEIHQAGDFLALRLMSKQITERYGWTRTNVRGLRQHPHFPEPDSHPASGPPAGGKGKWWWAATLDRWEAGVVLQTCPVCSARVQRLATHRKMKGH